MRRINCRIFICLLVAMTLPAVARAQSGGSVDVGQVTADQAEVRAGAGSSYYLVGQLKKGTIVNIEDRFFEWYKITPPASVYSYIKKKFVSPGAENGKGVIGDDRASVYAAAVSGPGESYRRQVDLHKGDSVDIVGEEGDYYKIKSPKHAYVFIRVSTVKRVDFVPAETTQTPTPPEPVAEAPAAETETETETTIAAEAETEAEVAATTTATQGGIVTATSETATTATTATETPEGMQPPTAVEAPTVVETPVVVAEEPVVETETTAETETAAAPIEPVQTPPSTEPATVTDRTVAAAEATGALLTDTVRDAAETTGAAATTAATATATTVETGATATVEATEPATSAAESAMTRFTEGARDVTNRAAAATGVAIEKTGDTVKNMARGAREMIDPTPEPLPTVDPNADVSVNATTTTTTNNIPPRVDDNMPPLRRTADGEIRVPPLTEGRLVTASSDGGFTRGPAPVKPGPIARSTPIVDEPTAAPEPAAAVEAESETPTAQIDIEAVTEQGMAASPAADAPMPTDLAGLEAKLAEAEKLPLEQQPISDLLSAYELLYSQPGLTPQDKRTVLQRIIKLRRNAALAQTLREIGQMQMTLSSEPATPVAPATPPAPPSPQYDAVGQLLASGVYDGVNLPRLYRIVSPRMRTIAYVRPAASIDSVAMLGKIVGVKGDTRVDQSLKLRVLEPSSIVVLSPNQAGALQ